MNNRVRTFASLVCGTIVSLPAEDFHGINFKGAGEKHPIRTRNTYVNCSFTDYSISLESGSEGTRFINCTFSGYVKSCNYVINVNTSDILIDSCRFLDNPGGCPGADFIMVNSNPNGRNSTVRKSLFRNYGADGVQIGHKAPNTRNWWILDNEFSGGQENGIDVKNSQDSIFILGNSIHGFDGCNPATENCNADNGMGIVIHMGASGVVVERNTIHDCDMGIHVKQDDGPIPSRILVRNNICRGNRRNGIRLSAGSDIRVFHNTLVDNGVNLQISTGAAGAAGATGESGNNLCIGAGACSGLLGGRGNLRIAAVSGAGFVNPARFDFHLTPASPAVDRGEVSPGIGPFDFEGDQRALGAGPDVGVDEYRPIPAGANRLTDKSSRLAGNRLTAYRIDGRMERRHAPASSGARARLMGEAESSTGRDRGTR